MASPLCSPAVGLENVDILDLPHHNAQTKTCIEPTAAKHRLHLRRMHCKNFELHGDSRLQLGDLGLDF